MHVRDIMKRNPLTVREDDALSTAQSLMAWAGIRHLPVLRQGRLSGILSERDLLAYRAEGHNLRHAPVREAMHPAPQTAHPDDSLTEVAGRMAVARIGALPVVTQGTLVGLITTTDVLAGEVQSAMAPRPASSATARDAMTRSPVTTRASERLTDAAVLMATHGIRHLPVLDPEGNSIGVLSERDVRAAIGDPAQLAERGEELERFKVGDAMSQPPICVTEDEPISALANLLADSRLGAVLVVDRNDSLVGMISYVDVLRSLGA
jgi:CBS domain-containing protein